MNKKAFFCIGMILIFMAAAVFSPINRNPARTGLFFSRERSRLARVFEKRGAREAKEFFINRYQYLDPATRHELEHVYGRELYRREGASGIVWCEEGSFFGCYHGFVAAAIVEAGRESVSAMEAACDKLDRTIARNGCIHGVGHGLMVHEGYQPESLTKALESCNVLLEGEKQRGCYQGVFMEYNIQTMKEATPVVEARSFSPGAPYEPCPSVAPAYRAACFYEIAGWWNIALSGDTGVMGRLCGMVEDDDSRRECFAGIGQIAVGITAFDKEATARVCGSMPDSEAAVACLFSAAVQYVYTDRISLARSLCDGLAQQEKNTCATRIEEARRE